MKRNNAIMLRQLWLIALLGLAGMLSARAQVSDSKKVVKGFRVDKSSIIDISNKYGDISLEVWDKDSVFVEIACEVSEKSYDRLQKKMDEINFELTHSGHNVVISTIIGESKNMIISELIKLKENIGMGESLVNIDMKIKVPDNLDLRIKNKFGNIYLDDYHGDLTIDLSNGKLKAHDLNGYVNLKLNFGNGVIRNIDSGNLEIYYSDFNLSSSRRLRVNSKTSDITFTEIGQLLVNSSRDHYRIRMINNFESQASWTDFSITEFTQKSNIVMNYGEITIENIRPSMENIMIDARSTRINLFFDRDADVNFDIITNRDLSLPNEAKIDETEPINEKEKIMRYIGRTGKIEKAKPKLILNTSSADIKILKR
ncbi:MAG: hypothetical protein JXR22_10245 [Prolixibacteraceae bacterium]|nr:hypothetical protein [Prolixibacteraceae bacterium]